MFSGIALLSYSAAALSFAVLACLLVIRRAVNGLLLPLACLSTAVWAAAVAFYLTTSVTLPLTADLLELSRAMLWILLLFALLGSFGRENTPAPLKFKMPLIACGLLCFCIAFARFASHLVPEPMFWAQASRVGLLILAVVGMMLVEQVFRNTTDTQRWGFKFACIAIGAMFAYDFYLYSDAVLFRYVDERIWTARGLVTALTAPLIAVAAGRQAQWQSRIKVSRHFLYHSVTLIGTAVYLLAMAAAGYYLRFFGGTWGEVMQVALLFTAVVLLAIVIFSGAFRSWLKVFISKHFYAYRYDYREEWLRFTRALSADSNRLGERAVQAIAELVHSPGGALWIARDSGYCEQAACWNMFSSTEAEPIDSALCRFMEREQWIVDLQDYAHDASKYGGLIIPPWLAGFGRAWLVVPLILQGRLFGFVVLAQPRSAIKLNWEVFDLLKIAGNQAASYLAQNESVKALMVARQFESFNRMSTFVVHDLKNLVAQLSLVLANADRHKDSPEFQKDMLETIAYSVDKMKVLLQKFSRNSSLERPSRLYLDQLLESLVASKSALRPQPTLQISERNLPVFANSARLERVISHLLHNAIEATDKNGRVAVRLARSGDAAVVEVEDTGQGMSEEFIEQRLFKPFESTKLAGMGIGVFEMREYVLELGGKVEVVSRLSMGTTFKLTLPLHVEFHPAVAEAA